MRRLFTVVAIALMSCSPKINPSYTPLQGANSFDLQGHRGCRGLYPENTIHAFLNSVSMMITTLEMDVVITKDKKVVVSHDNYFNELINNNT